MYNLQQFDFCDARTVHANTIHCKVISLFTIVLYYINTKITKLKLFYSILFYF